MSSKDLPHYVENVLSRLEDVHPTHDGWDARCPCPDHNATSGQPGDHHPSLRITVADDGHVLMKCRVGCKTDSVLNAIGLGWQHVFPPAGYQATSPPLTKEPCLPRCGNTLAHRAYTLLLENLDLSEGHRRQLLERGVPSDRISIAQYRTLRNVDRGRAAKAVHARVGDEVFAVPGFVNGDFGITVAGTSTGLLIPVRDTAGDIQALKIRRDGTPKYLYLTGGQGGASSGSPMHVPLGVPRPAREIRVTEGELKADICTWLDATPTIGIPGVTQWRAVLPVLRTLEARKVVMAFDAPDLYRKPPVYNEARQFWQVLRDAGFEVELEDWYDGP